ncbi:MAG: AraC family transcriptional regulator [Ruminococcus sp.]|nr:AraC family transcriptional regulator [Ruminococcus sp.]
MKCLCAGYHHRHDERFVIDRPDGSGDWLMLIIKTPAVFRINGEEIHAKAGSYIIYSLGTPLYYSADKGEYIDDWLHFFPDEEDMRLISELSIPLNKPVYVGNVYSLSTIMRNICFEYYSAHTNRHLTVSLYFRIMLCKLNEQELFRYKDSHLTETKYMSDLLWIRESIFRWPEQKWNTDFFADELGISRSRFQHLYKDAFGSTMIQDIIDSRILRGCELLTTTDAKVEEIAEMCGYNSVSHFVKLFREKTGITPLTYRKENRKPAL